MIATTPRGFRDVLSAEAQWRRSLIGAIDARFFAWGYEPVQTPTLESLDVLQEMGGLQSSPFRFYDRDGKLLALRPDVTVPVARLVGMRMRGKEAPFRLSYSAPVFREKESLQAQDREFWQAGVECIGPRGVAADAEVLCLFVEALEACGLREFTVALGCVGVLNALIEGAAAGPEWAAEVRRAFHTNDVVRIDQLCSEAQAGQAANAEYAAAISQLVRISGGQEALAACRQLVEPLGAAAGLDELEAIFTLAAAQAKVGQLLVDFSIISNFDYYTGIVFKAYAPECGMSLGSGGRYDSLLARFGREEAAAGFAIGIERVMEALEGQGVQAPQVAAAQEVQAATLPELFEKAAALREAGQRAVIGGCCE